MRVSILLLLIMFILFALVFSIFLYMPSTTLYSPWNSGDSGLSIVFQELNPHITRGLNDVACDSLILIILQRRLTIEEANQLSSLVRCGSIVVVGDVNGYSRPLLENLNIAIEFGKYPVLDEISAMGYRWIIRSNTKGFLNMSIAIPNATALIVSQEPDLIYAYTSRYAYIDLNGNGFYDLDEPMARYLILCGWRISNGILVLIPSQLFFTNRYIVLKDNLELVRGLSSGRSIYLYIDTLMLSTFDKVKEELYGWSAGRPLYITHFIALIVSSILTFTWFSNNFDWNKYGRRINMFLIGLVSIPYIVSIYLYNNMLYAIPLAVLFLFIFLNPSSFPPIMVSMSLVSTGFNYVYTLLYILVIIIVGRYVKFGEGRGFLGYASLSLLMLQGINALTIIIYPQIVIGLLSASLAIISIAVIRYVVYLRPTVIEPLSTGGEVYVGSRISIGFLVKSVKRIICIVETWRNRVVELVDSSGIVVVNEVIEHVGINRVNVWVSIADPWGFAFRSIGLYRFGFNALPMTSKLLEKAQYILGRLGIGVLSSEISMTVLIRLDELGRFLSIPGERFEAMLRSTGQVFGVGLAGFLRRIIEEYVAGKRLEKSRIGEYVGVREYEPGDPFRVIHWKKSLGKQMLISKEYSASSEGGGTESGGGTTGGVLLIVNLDASNPLELDALLASVLHYVITNVSRDPDAWLDILMISGPYIAVLKGSAAGILKLLYDTLRKSPIEARYSYESINRYMGIDEIVYMHRLSREVFKVVSTALSLSGRMVVEALAKSGYRPPRTYILLHGRALSTWASYVMYILNSLGYSYRPFVEVVGNV